MSRYAKIRRMDISNGPGIRVSIFFQGCNFHCKDCFNPETWDAKGGNEFTEETKNIILDLCNKDSIAGLSILGGEPFIEDNLESLLDLVSSFKKRFPDKNIWLWTGYRLKDLTNSTKIINDILNHIDYLVDGLFISSKKDLTLLYRGSSNQTIWAHLGDKWLVSKYNN